MKNLVKILSLAAWVAVMFASCEKEQSTNVGNDVVSQELVPKDDRSSMPLVTNLAKEKTLGSEKVEFSEVIKKNGVYPHSTFSQKQSFQTSDFVFLSGLGYFPTVVVGDQRWIIANPLASATVGKAKNVAGVAMYNYEAAMSFNNTPVTMSFPMPGGLSVTAVGNFHIPTWEEENHLHHMVYGDEKAILAGLGMTRSTGMYVDAPGKEYHGIRHSTENIHWNAERIKRTDNPGYTYHLTSGDPSTNSGYLFQCQLEETYAPILLVQQIIPVN